MTVESPRAAPSRPGRAPDYRLRGLDLSAPGVAEPRPRPVQKKHPSLRRRRRQLLLKWAAVVAVMAIVVVLLRAYVVQPYSVSSASMVPALQPGTDVLVLKEGRFARSIGSGDIVVFREPKHADCSNAGSHSHDLVERVIGLPGETIWSVGGTIYVNGQVLNEPGWYNPPFGEVGSTPIARTNVPEGSYFVMGDNRTVSCDSRSFGPVAKSQIVGRVVATITHGGHPSVHSV